MQQIMQALQQRQSETVSKLKLDESRFKVSKPNDAVTRKLKKLWG